jgi:uncharacterized protein YbaP (TraB family)
MRLRSAEFLLALLLAQVANADPLRNELSTYAALTSPKAAAVAVDDASIVGIASGQLSDAAASLTALQQCRDVRSDPVPVCEVTRVNDTTVTSAEAIRARVPRTVHPLFLWRFDAPGGGSQVYLAGSVHVMKPSLYPLPAQFDAAFARADRLVVEVDTQNLDAGVAAEKFRTYALLPEGQTIYSVLKPATLEAVAAYLAGQSSSIGSVATMKPALIATQLAVMRMTALGYMPEFGLEEHFISAAGSRPVLQLESLDDQLEVLTSATPEVQDDLLLETLRQMDTVEPIIAGMATAWLAGDDAEFQRLFDEDTGSTADTREFERRLIEERNVTMADKIAGYLTQPGTTFVLVGSAHLIGPEGVVALLEARGLPGRRIQSNDSI